MTESAAVSRRLGPSDLTPEVLDRASRLLAELVAHGAALGWVDPPAPDEVAHLLRDVADAAGRGDACLVAAWDGEALAGLGYWRRYTRPTHHPHADVEKVAVAGEFQGRGVGRQMMSELIAAAHQAGIEWLTLDFRGDNTSAAALYRSLSFSEYGHLPGFVAVGERRYDKIFYALDLRGSTR